MYWKILRNLQQRYFYLGIGEDDDCMTWFTDKIVCRFKSSLKSIIGEYQCCLILRFLVSTRFRFRVYFKTEDPLDVKSAIGPYCRPCKSYTICFFFSLTTQLPRHKDCVLLCTLWACNRPHIMRDSVHILCLLVPIKQDPTFVSGQHPSLSQNDRLGQRQTPEKIRQYFVLFAIRTHC
jgi:hypothetical protein